MPSLARLGRAAARGGISCFLARAARAALPGERVDTRVMRPAPIEIEVGYRSRWLAQLRWAASSAIIYGTFIATSVAGFRLDPIPLYLIGATVAVYNSLFLIALKWSEVGPQEGQLRSARLLTNGQIAVDLATLALLLHFTGGVENPLAFYFVFHVIIASILLSRREAFLQATLACLLYGGLLLAELGGLAPHVHVIASMRDQMAQDPLLVGTALAAFSSALYLAAYMATTIVARLRKREQEIMRLTRQLEFKARELERAYDDVSKLEEVESRQLRKVSQELRAPLASVQERLRNLRDGLVGGMSPSQQEVVARAERTTAELLSFLSDVSVLSRAREARLATERKPVDLGALARRVVEAQGSTAANWRVDLQATPCGQEALVSGDEAALEQLLSHLVSNALRYTPGGGRVELRMERLGEVVRVQVADSGIGIPAEDLSRVFGEFYRAENARRFREQGTGLGLAMARSIVEGHGGQIELESQLGAGTVVTVLLPALNRPPEEEGQAPIT